MIFLIFAIVFFSGICVGWLAYSVVARIPDGSIIVIENPDGSKVYSLELDADPYFLDEKSIVKFRVIREE